MKKTILLLTALLLALVLSGCTENEIHCGVDTNNNAYLRYDIVLDLSGVSASDDAAIRDGLQKLTSYYHSTLGFRVKDNVTDYTDTIELHMTYRVKNDSFEEAMESLQSLLADETRVPFSASAVDWEIGELVQSGAVTVQIDADQILAAAQIEDFPRSQAQLLDTALSDCTLTLELTLPATELPREETATLSDGLASKQTRVRFDAPTELSLQTRLSVSGEMPAQEWLEQTEDEAVRMQWAVIILGAAAATCILVALILFLLRRKSRASHDSEVPMTQE